LSEIEAKGNLFLRVIIYITATLICIILGAVLVGFILGL